MSYTAPLLCVLAWLIFGLFISSILHSLRKGITYVRRLHQIPCDRCAFFTGNPCLKCTVRPSDAMTESAIGCHDFEPLPPSSGQNVAKSYRTCR
jgi:hypothetical protein